jgi:hypothetical protein
MQEDLGIQEKMVVMLKRNSPLKKSGKGLKRSGGIKSKAKTPEQVAKGRYERDKMNAFWEYCWEILPKESEISGRKFKQCNKCHYHHTLAKSLYPELKFSISGILRVTPQEHTLVDANPEIYNLNMERRKYVIDNWTKCIEESRDWSEQYDKLKKEED